MKNDPILRAEIAYRSNRIKNSLADARKINRYRRPRKPASRIA